MSPRVAAWLAWTLATLSVVIFLAGVALFVLAHSAQLPSTLDASVTVIDMLTSVPFWPSPW